MRAPRLRIDMDRRDLVDVCSRPVPCRCWRAPSRPRRPGRRSRSSAIRGVDAAVADDDRSGDRAGIERSGEAVGCLSRGSAPAAGASPAYTRSPGPHRLQPRPSRRVSFGAVAESYDAWVAARRCWRRPSSPRVRGGRRCARAGPSSPAEAAMNDAASAALSSAISTGRLPIGSASLSDEIEDVDAVADCLVDRANGVDARAPVVGRVRGRPARLVDRQCGGRRDAGDPAEALPSDRDRDPLVACRGRRDVGAVTAGVARRQVLRSGDVARAEALDVRLGSQHLAVAEGGAPALAVGLAGAAKLRILPDVARASSMVAAANEGFSGQMPESMTPITTPSPAVLRLAGAGEEAADAEACRLTAARPAAGVTRSSRAIRSGETASTSGSAWSCLTCCVVSSAANPSTADGVAVQRLGSPDRCQDVVLIGQEVPGCGWWSAARSASPVAARRTCRRRPRP